MMLVLPTDWSPKNTSLYLARGETAAISFFLSYRECISGLWVCRLGLLDLNLRKFSLFWKYEREREKEKEKEKGRQDRMDVFELNVFIVVSRRNRQTWRSRRRQKKIKSQIFVLTSCYYIHVYQYGFFSFFLIIRIMSERFGT